MTIECLHHISDYLRFQVDGIKRIIIGNSSSLPASMSNIRTNLENGEKIEKFHAHGFLPGPGRAVPPWGQVVDAGAGDAECERNDALW